jgi:hypothetical protein
MKRRFDFRALQRDGCFLRPAALTQALDRSTTSSIDRGALCKELAPRFQACGTLRSKTFAQTFADGSGRLR